MKLIFLDIDGCLNNHDFDQNALSGRIHRDKVDLLNKVLIQTGACIVISSAWRYIIHRDQCTLEGFDWMLRSHGLIHSRLVGITRKDDMPYRMLRFDGKPESWPVENERGQQITDYLKNLLVHVDKYVVIDDLDLGISERHPFVQTDGTVGLTATDAWNLIRMLS